MCEPTTWAAIALTAAGTYEQHKGDQMSRNAMEQARQAEAERQAKLRSQSDALFQQSLSRSSQPQQEQQLGAAVQARQAAATASQKAAPVASAPVQGGTPKVVSDETAARVTQGNTEAARTASLKAALQGFGDLQLGNALANARFARGQSTIGNFMTGSQNVLGTELEAASHRGDRLKSIGGGLQAIGQLVGLYGAMSPGAAAPTNAYTAGQGMAPYANIAPKNWSMGGGWFPK